MSAASTDNSHSTHDTGSSGSSGLSEWLTELAIGVVVVVLGMAVWAYTHFNDGTRHHDRPKPVWLGISKVMAQMGDGRMVNLKVNLRLAHEEDVEALDAHVPAFKSLIQETGSQLSRETLQSKSGVQQLSKAIRTALNGYLEDHDMDARVKDVAFDELMLLP